MGKPVGAVARAAGRFMAPCGRFMAAPSSPLPLAPTPLRFVLTVVTLMTLVLVVLAGDALMVRVKACSPRCRASRLRLHTDATWGSFVATAAQRVLDPNLQRGVRVLDSAGCELRELAEVEAGQQLYIVPVTQSEGEYRSPVPSPVSDEDAAAEEHASSVPDASVAAERTASVAASSHASLPEPSSSSSKSSKSQPVKFGGRPSQREKRLRGKRLLSVPVKKVPIKCIEWT